MIKACLFDLDGVVFDTEPQYTVFWGQICREYHPDKPGLEHKIKGQTLVQIYDGYFSDYKSEQEKITKRLDDFESKMRFDYLPGFLKFIDLLKRKGIGTAVVTSSNKAKMESVYRQHPEFKDIFDYILTSEDFSESKPSPDCYIRGAKCFNTEPKNCIVYEDSFNGLKSGCASGAYVVGLATTNSAEAIAPYCDKVIKDYVDYEI